MKLGKVQYILLFYLSGVATDMLMICFNFFCTKNLVFNSIKSFLAVGNFDFWSRMKVLKCVKAGKKVINLLYSYVSNYYRDINEWICLSSVCIYRA